MTPQLRFPEFTDEWQTGLLNSLLTPTMAKNENLGFDKSQVLSVAAEAGVVNQIAYHGRSYAGASVKPYNIVRKGEIVYTKSPLKAYPYGIIKLNEGEDGIVSTLYAVYKINKKASGRFLNYYFYDPLRINKYLKPLVNIGAKNDMKINNSTVTSGLVKFPGFEEQQKIADYLGEVDSKLTSIQNKVNAIHEYKKGVMQTLFSGKLRFKNGDGDSYPEWEEKQLSDIMTERNTQAPKSNDYPLMAFVAHKGVTPKGERYNREFLVGDSSGKKYKKTEYGDFIYSSNNLETGSIGLNLYGSASISPVYSIFHIDSSCDPHFLGSYLLRKEFIYKLTRYRQGVVYGQWRINETNFLKIKERIPSTKEQQKIADFLIAIDEKIKLEEAKLASAMEFKKALLQRMFV